MGATFQETLTVETDQSVTGAMTTVKIPSLEQRLTAGMPWTALASLMAGTLIRTAAQSTGTALVGLLFT